MEMEPLDYSLREPRTTWPLLALGLLFGITAAATSAGLMYIAVYGLGKWERMYGQSISWTIGVIGGFVIAILGMLILLAVSVLRMRHCVPSLRGVLSFMLAGAVYAVLVFVPDLVDTYWHSGAVQGINTPYSSGVGEGIGIAAIFSYPPIIAFWLVKRRYEIQRI